MARIHKLEHMYVFCMCVLCICVCSLCCIYVSSLSEPQSSIDHSFNTIAADCKYHKNAPGPALGDVSGFL